MEALRIIKKYYQEDSKSHRFLVEHSRAVQTKALEIANNIPELNPDLKFIEEASMLHDIGIMFINDAEMGCFGDKSYICHGYLGRELLEREGLPKHALVCERHVGVGLAEIDIKEQNLPIPLRNMVPNSLEEQIICFADNFFTKDKNNLSTEIKIDEIRVKLQKYGKDKVERFNTWAKKFKC